MPIQLAFVFVILLAAVSFAAYRLYKALTYKGNGCYGCPLRDTCDKTKRRLSHPKRYSDRDLNRHKGEPCRK